ncbi:class I SAM-dependent methyltransferase [Luteolibacter sp. AS25]|uniref:class I SAM-dependent methyltransferase n=1 Tax=Luteolibacter sp. AS25 TaxID=3135776 RepID=UPI00398B8941
METVLYDPESGYYSSGAENVGKDGDFFTSVSVGPLFGRLLAGRFISWWENHGKPDKWRVLEIGANDGKLAADVLVKIREQSPEAWESLEYAIAEPLPTLVQAQHERLQSLASKLRIEESLEELMESKRPGVAFGNEILDALPFHLIRFENAEWKELYVAIDAEQSLAFTSFEIEPNSRLSSHTEKLGANFPEMYQTEIRTNLRDFLADVSNCLVEGTLLFIDYGFASEEYFHPARTTGTLRTYSKHQAAEDPLDRPGEIDITAHVNFTDLACSAEEIGYKATSFSSQSSYLTHLAKASILKGELNTPKEISQFQTLVHPAHLGEKFHVIEFEQNSHMPDIVRHRLAL